MKEYQDKNTILFKFEILEQFHEVRHHVTTRHGGFSKENYKGFNLGFGTEDDPKLVLRNRYIFSESLGIPLDWLVFMRQTHSANIVVVNNSHMGSGSYSLENAINNTDALITADKNVCINVQVADCVPILLFDCDKDVIAVVHAGWRGTLQEITRQTIEKMVQGFSSNPEDIIAGIGPSIGPCCYAVGNEILQQFLLKNNKYSDAFTSNDTLLKLDLRKTNKMQLLDCGVKEENIEVADLCTCCNHDTFYSSRFDKGITGRFVAGIMII